MDGRAPYRRVSVDWKHYAVYTTPKNIQRDEDSASDDRVHAVGVEMIHSRKVLKRKNCDYA